MRANFSKPGTIFDSMSKETFSVIETIVKLKMSLLTAFFALHLHETIKGMPISREYGAALI